MSAMKFHLKRNSSSLTTMIYSNPFLGVYSSQHLGMPQLPLPKSILKSGSNFSFSLRDFFNTLTHYFFLLLIPATFSLVTKQQQQKKRKKKTLYICFLVVFFIIKWLLIIEYFLCASCCNRWYTHILYNQPSQLPRKGGGINTVIPIL